MAGKLWRSRVGPHGARVIAQERSIGGNVRLGVYDPELGGRRWRSLGFKVRNADAQLMAEAVESAKREAAKLSNRLIEGETPSRRDVTCAELLRAFARDEVSAMREPYRRDVRRDVGLLTRQLGRLKVKDLGPQEWNALAHRRATGAIDARGYSVVGTDRRPVSARSVAKTLKTLRQACQYGLAARRSGRPLLALDPTVKLRLPSNPNPARPVCTDDQYARLFEASTRHTMRVGARYVPSYLPTLLILCAETGRRVGAVVALRWDDWMPDQGTYGTIRWRADSDKLGRQSVTPVTPEARDALKQQRQNHPSTAGWIFAAPKGEGHIGVTLASHWLRDAEQLAEIEHVRGFGFHALRRMFATKRKGMSIKDVAGLGGWKGTQVLQSLYQRADMDSMERVLLEGRNVKLRLVG